MVTQTPELENQSDKPRLGWGLKLMLALFGVVILAILGLWAYTTRLDNEVIARQEQLRAKGYSVTYQELATWYPPIPYEDNAAPILERAFQNYFKPQVGIWPEEKMNQFDLFPFIGKGEIPPLHEISPELKQTMREYMRENVPALELIHEAAQKKGLRNKYDFNQGSMILLPSLADFRQAGMLLSLDSFLQLEEGQTENAIKDARDQQALVRLFKDEPFIISHLVRISMYHQMFQNVEMILSRAELSSQQIDELQRILDDGPNPDWLRRGLQSELPASHEWLIRGRDLDAIGHSQPLGRFNAVYGILGLRQKDYLAWVELYEKQQKNLDNCVAQDCAFATLFDMDKELQELPRTRLVTRRGFPALGRVITLYFRAVAAQRTALAGVAVARYRLEKGKLPENLEQLVPAYLEKVPNDPFASQPLKFVKMEKGYKVYSLGEDRSDDGGKATDENGRRNESGTDICFTVEK